MSFLPKKSRWIYVLQHAAVGGVVAVLFEFLGADLLLGVLAGLYVLLAKETGEIIGKAKAAGSFVNNFGQNLDAVGDAVNDKWQLWQTAGAMAVFVVARVIILAVFGI